MRRGRLRLASARVSQVLDTWPNRVRLHAEARGPFIRAIQTLGWRRGAGAALYGSDRHIAPNHALALWDFM